MTIKITGLELVRDPSRAFRAKDFEKHALHSVKGNLKLDITQNDITGQAEQALFAISKELQLKLLNVINEIEDELNGVEKEVNIDSNKLSYEDVSNGGKIANLHTGEKVLNKSEVDKILNQAFDLAKKGVVGTDIFVKSQNNAENFAKGITEILDLYSEFAKIGNKKVSKKDDDLSADLF